MPAQSEEKQNHWRKLTPEEERVIVHKGTDRPFSGEYDDHDAPGIYTCRRCGAMLYRSEDKFRSHCGWPSFDSEIPGAIRRLPDPDGSRIEIVCAHCEGHLGHVFEGEGFTPKNTRHCVNSTSMDFVAPRDLKCGRAIFAGGCFWGVEHFLRRCPGVLYTTVGYSGGNAENPTYQEVCGKKTGHAEAVEVIFDPARVSFEDLAPVFRDPRSDPDRQAGAGHRESVPLRDFLPRRGAKTDLGKIDRASSRK